jgi:hypothetical protein
MLNFKKLLCVFSLFIMSQTLCMDEERKTRIEVLDDGHEWTMVEYGQDIRPFRGMVLACRSFLDHMDAYKDPNSETRYVLVSRYCTYDGFGHRLFAAYSGKPGASDRYFFRRYYQHDPVWWSNNPIAILRLLTQKEMRQLLPLMRNKVLEYHDPTIPSNTFQFTLGNLMEKERRAYCWNHARKKVWPKQRLMHIGSKELGSGFHGVPRDIVRLIARQVIDQEANELMKITHREDPLVLE